MEVLFPIVFLFVIGMFVYVIGSGVTTWVKNNNSPRLTVPATVVAKRGQRHHHHHQHGTTTSTSWHVTFQFESGDRLELKVPSNEIGYLIEGDYGNLTFQGTRYVSFER